MKQSENKLPVEQAAELMEEIAALTAKITRHTDKANKQIDQIKNDLSVKTEEWVKKSENLNIELEHLAETHKNELFPPEPTGKTKQTISLKLKSGEFGFKTVSSLEIQNIEQTAKIIEEGKRELAEQTGIASALSRKPNIDKRKLKGFKPEILKVFGIIQEEKTNFFCKINGATK